RGSRGNRDVLRRGGLASGSAALRLSLFFAGFAPWRETMTTSSKADSFGEDAKTFSLGRVRLCVIFAFWRAADKRNLGIRNRFENPGIYPRRPPARYWWRSAVHFASPYSPSATVPDIFPPSTFPVN